MKVLVSSKDFFTWTLISALVWSNVKANYGDQCMEDSDCQETVKEIYCGDDHICSCQDDSFFFDVSFCNTRVNNGATCDDTKANEKQCYDNAHCVVNQAGEKKCVCKPGYTQVDETTCSKGSVAQKIDVFLIGMIYLMGVFIYRVFL